MLKVLDPTREDNRETSEGAVPTLDELAREGARRMLMAAFRFPLRRAPAAGFLGAMIPSSC